MKNIEDKAADALTAAFRDKYFRDFELSRIIVEKGLGKEMFNMVIGFLAFISVYAKYDYYPYGLEDESNTARAILVDHFDIPLDS